MYPRAFEYTVPESVGEAVQCLSRYGEEAKVLAGGQSLIPLMKLRLVGPGHLIDIGRLADLRYIKETSGVLRIGALTTHASVLEASPVRQHWPLIADAVSVIGDTQVRNWGTAGGALAEADPAGDWGPVALALQARIRCLSVRGERLLDAENFFGDAYTPNLSPDELITEIIFPATDAHRAAAYLKLERRAGDFAVVSVAVQLTMAERGICKDARIALGAAGLTPVVLSEVTPCLAGKELRPEVIDEAARQVTRAAQPLEDHRGSQDYKRAAAGAVFKQAVELALRRAREAGVGEWHGQ